MFKKILVILLVMTVFLVGCIETPTPTVVPTDVPTVVPTPKPIEYLIIKEDKHAPVWPKVDAQVNVLGYLKDGDNVPVRTRHMMGDTLWLEVLVGELYQFETGTTGWVKFRAEKMFTEWRQP